MTYNTKKNNNFIHHNKLAIKNQNEALSILDTESDEEMREFAKEELTQAKKRETELEQELKILLLPKDPNDDKNIMLEIRAGAGGDEAALFAAELYRMYIHYAESLNWKTEIISLSENGIGGFKEVVAMISGKGAYSKLNRQSKRLRDGRKRHRKELCRLQSSRQRDRKSVV